MSRLVKQALKETAAILAVTAVMAIGLWCLFQPQP